MPAPRELSEEAIKDIQESKGKLSISQVKKKFGIGSDRLAKIWGQDMADRDGPTEPAEAIAQASTKNAEEPSMKRIPKTMNTCLGITEQLRTLKIQVDEIILP